ncbi:MAG: DNA replication/repair protein RecF [Proteobacteria bacterium]|nr:DNA replication/repair protein RecF [Pseudomonadota bacterium]MDA0928179.1 DNA replication/repair protein RecF [Pseudomonadota bacterium]
MTALTRLEVSKLRNLREIRLDLSRQFNLVYGLNGSGKTSILESVNLLATGKSFRSALVDPLVMEGESAATVFAQTIDKKSIGLSRPRKQRHQLRLNGINQSNWDEVARELPVQVLDAGAFQLLEGGPKARRRFMDWGVFHVEPGFVAQWRRVRRCLAQRNRLLKQTRLPESEIAVWDRELCEAAALVHQFRWSYLGQLLPLFQETFSEVFKQSAERLSITYQCGWDENIDLSEQLLRYRPMDVKYGSTQLGPHRADISLKIGSRKAIEVLSRGQQKLLICALKFTQGKLLAESVNRKCTYLVDDLPAELDTNNRRVVVDYLAESGSQVFMTSVESSALDLRAMTTTEIAKFHVERGIIKS